MYHKESIRVFDELTRIKPSLVGRTLLQIGDISIEVEGKDGLGGLIEEWFGQWAKQSGFQVTGANKAGQSQEFPDFYIGKDRSLLEIKCFDGDAGANFDLANFDSYCFSLAQNPYRLWADYLIFSYKLDGATLIIDNVWLKKIWEITCSSARYPLKTQVKKGVIYNIRPASWYSAKPSFKPFTCWQEFVSALYETEKAHHNLVASANEQLFNERVKNI